MTQFELYLSGVAKFIGYLAVIYGFYRIISQDWNKKKKEQAEARAKAELESHAPIVEKIDTLESNLGSKIDKIQDELDDIREEQRTDRDLNKQVARLSLAMADETGETKGTNGMTKKAAQELRETLLSRA